MNQALIVLIVVIIGRAAVICEKKAMVISKIDSTVVVWYLYGFGFLFLTTYLAYKNQDPLEVIQDKLQAPSFKWIFIAAIFATLYSVGIAPLLQNMDYSIFSALKGPLAMITAIAASYLIFGENITWNVWVAVILFIIAALLANGDIITGLSRIARLRP